MNTSVTKDIRIYEELRQQILGRALRPGIRLVEDDICRQFGVTRTPVRQALRRLEQEGLVVNEPYCGSRIREITTEEFGELFDVREMLEGLAARNIASGGNDTNFAELARLANRVDDAATKNDWSRYFEADRYFHEAIVSLSGNRKLTEIMTVSSFQLRSFAFYDRYLLDIISRVRAVEQQGSGRHRALVAIIESGDPDQAEQAVRKHIRDAKILVESAVAAEERS
jgi:DNA-binding GntR family transcriptional regulator